MGSRGACNSNAAAWSKPMLASRTTPERDMTQSPEQFAYSFTPEYPPPPSNCSPVITPWRGASCLKGFRAPYVS